jgi:glyoxylase-like metal-dependent hydrolase (beta-lactamase superfamily II)
MFELLDLHFLGEEQLFCTYLLDLEDGLALVDPGPWTTLSTLESGLAELGVSFAELRHLLITHIHFDHAGACGALVAANPLLRVHVSERGAPHLVRPERLERSARRLYGDMFDVLWGRVQPVPAENIRVAGDRVAGLDCFAAPGHAVHHVCFMSKEGMLFAGDTVGVRWPPSQYILPATPPPDVDLDAWHTSLDEIERRAPAALALPHFGLVAEPEEHLRVFRQRLMLWAEIVRRGVSVREFVDEVSLDIDDETAKFSELTDLLRHSYLGLKRYWGSVAERS